MTVARVIAGADEKIPLLYTSTQLVVGEVVAAGGGAISVRLPSSARTVGQVYQTEGVEYQTGDRVLLAKVPGEAHWIALVRVLTTAETGSAGASLGEDVLHPPSNLSVEGYAGIVVAQWDCWTGGTVAFEVQSNIVPDDGGAQRLYTRGSVFIRECTSGSIYIRIRSLRYNVAEDVAYYSGWTSWGSASSVAVATATDIANLQNMLLAWMHHQEEKWIKHRLGDTE